MSENAIVKRRHSEHIFYLAMAFVFPIVVLAGFARTYYLKVLYDTPALPGYLVHFHGLVMTSWVVLFVVQVMLVANGRVRLHRRLGIAGLVLAGLVVVVGVMTAVAAAARGHSPGPPPLVFLVVPLGDIVVYAVLVGTALWFRRRPALHKRLMALGAVSLLTPAIARIPLQFIATGGPLAFFGLTDVVLLGCVAYDTIVHRRLHRGMALGALFIIVSQPLRLLVGATDAWLWFATRLVG